MQAEHFEHTFGGLAAVLGDRTRRGIYLAALRSQEPVTAGRIADLFGIHPNVARHHLDRLVADGYLRVGTYAPAGARREVGRPPKAYRPTEKDISVAYPVRRHDLLAELLVRVVKRLAPDEGPRLAEEVGREYGRELAATIGLARQPGDPEALAAVARALADEGFDLTADAEAGCLIAEHCPFGATAGAHPEVVCRLDRGILEGLFEAARGEARRVQVRPRRHPDRSCVN